MKNKLIVFYIILFSLSLLSLVNGLDLGLEDKYYSGQTIISEIDGNLISSIKSEDMTLRYGRKIIPVINDVAKLDDNYFLYLVLPIEERNYTLEFDKLHYFDLGKEFNEVVEKNFSIHNVTIADFSVNPGFIITNDSFNIKIQNNVNDIIVTTKFFGIEESFSLSSGKSKNLEFSVLDYDSESNDSNIEYLSISSNNINYDIPILILESYKENNDNFSSENNSESNDSNDIIKEDSLFKFSKNSIRVEMGKDQEKIIDVFLEPNTKDFDYDDALAVELIVSEDLTDVISISPKVALLDSGGPEDIEILVSPKISGLYSGNIMATYKTSGDDKEFFSTISFSVVVSEDRVEEPQVDVSKLDSCVALGGIICYSDELCSGGEVLDSKEGACCSSGGECKLKSEGGSSTTIFIWVGVIIAIIVGIFLFKKYKKTGKSAENILKDKEKAFDKKFKGKV